MSDLGVDVQESNSGGDLSGKTDDLLTKYVKNPSNYSIRDRRYIWDKKKHRNVGIIRKVDSGLYRVWGIEQDRYVGRISYDNGIFSEDGSLLTLNRELGRQVIRKVSSPFKRFLYSVSDSLRVLVEE